MIIFLLKVYHRNIDALYDYLPIRWLLQFVITQKQIYNTFNITTYEKFLLLIGLSPKQNKYHNDLSIIIDNVNYIMIISQLNIYMSKVQIAYM